MANPIISAILNAAGGSVFDTVRGIINEFHASPEQTLAATQKLAELEAGTRVRESEAAQAFADAQSKVIIAEASSDSWLTKSWRPITMLAMLAMVLWNIIVIGTIAAFTSRVHPVDVPPDAWALLKLGIGGYIGARSAEKIAGVVPDIVAAIKK